MGGFAWVTLATNDSYSLGALVLAHSLKAAGTAHQLAVLVTPGVTSAMRDKLASVFNLVQEVNILDSRDEANLRLLKRPELGITFTKLHCWRLTQYEKCVFLDADTLVLQHCDELFEREELSAAPDVGWPDCFNSGVFVYRPSLDTYEKLIQFALEKGSFDGGDQGLLNLYFSDWAHKDISKHLPFIYNMCSTACYSYLPAFKQFGANAKIIHFIGAQKPWLQYFNTETRRVQPSGDSAHLQEVLQRWWDIFCSLIHPMLSPAMPQGQLQHGVSPSYFPPQYAPPPNPTSSADDYESAWDPWDEYDQKIAQTTHYTSAATHYNHNQPIESLNTNASHVAQLTIHSQPQSHNHNTFSAQNNSFYQPQQPVYQHIPRVPTPPPSPQPQHHQPQYYHQKPHHHHPQPQYHHNEPPNNHSEPQFHHQETNGSDNNYPQPQYDNQQEHYQQQTKHTEHYNEQHYHNYQEQTHSPSQELHYHHPRHNDNHQHLDTHDRNDHFHSHQTTVESFSSNSERPRSPNYPDPIPILPKECEATITVSNDMSLSSTIEDCNTNDDAGLAGAFAQLTLGVPRSAEQDALENVLRKQAWEVGNIDYLGKDSFDNIWSKITETLSASPPQPPAAAPALEKEQEPQPSAPAQSQSQSAPQEEAKPIQPSATPIDTPLDKSLTTDDSQKASSESTSAVQTPVDQGESTEISSIPVSKEVVEPVTSEPKVVEKEKEASQAASAPQVVQESVASKEKELEVKPAVCPIPEKKETKGEETKIEEPKADIPETPVEKVETTETQACPVLPKAATESKTLETEPPKETIATSEVCPLPPKKETSQDSAPQVKETEESLTQSSKKADEVTSPQTAQQEAPQVASPVAESPKITSQEQELPKAAQEVSKSTKPSTEEIKEPAVVQQPEAVPEKQIVSSESPSESLPVQPLQQVQTSPSSKEVTKPVSESISKTPEVPSKAPEAAPKAPEAKSKAPEATPKAPEATPKAPEATPKAPEDTPKAPEAVPKPVQAASKVPEAPSKVDVPSASSLAASSAPKTKVTEATPPATPASPLVEKTKQSLDAKASIPETPPPTEGASTPMPPPRKTDKPKKAAAKPKK